MDEVGENIAVQPNLQETPIKKNINFIPFIIVGACTLLIGLAGGYFILGNKMSPPSLNSVQNTSAILTPTPTVSLQITTTPVTNSIPNWKTYTNQQLGISFQYPPDWVTANPFGQPSTVAFVGLIPANKTQGEVVTPIDVEHFDNPKNLSLQDFETDHDANSAMNLNLYTPQLQSTSFAGIPAYFQQKAGCEPLICEKAVFLVKNNIFAFYNTHIINHQYSDQELQSYEGIFSQILSTVHFANN